MIGAALIIDKELKAIGMISGFMALERSAAFQRISST
jgi:hypothetical protein